MGSRFLRRSVPNVISGRSMGRSYSRAKPEGNKRIGRTFIELRENNIWLGNTSFVCGILYCHGECTASSSTHFDHFKVNSIYFKMESKRVDQIS